MTHFLKKDYGHCVPFQALWLLQDSIKEEDAKMLREDPDEMDEMLRKE